MLEKAAEQLMSCFRVCASDKSVNIHVLCVCVDYNSHFIHYYISCLMDVLVNIDIFNVGSRAGIEDSKKWGMMFLSNQLFKIYFKV